jgi:hypothetical protein
MGNLVSTAMMANRVKGLDGRAQHDPYKPANRKREGRMATAMLSGSLSAYGGGTMGSGAYFRPFVSTGTPAPTARGGNYSFPRENTITKMR